jgi:hypothetical protein
VLGGGDRARGRDTSRARARAKARATARDRATARVTARARATAKARATATARATARGLVSTCSQGRCRSDLIQGRVFSMIKYRKRRSTLVSRGKHSALQYNP